jgi:hypothetical protein
MRIFKVLYWVWVFKLLESESLKMKKIGFIFSYISILIGATIFVTTSILNQLLPKLGYLVFKVNSGSYSPDEYVMNFTVVNGVAVAMVVAGIALSVYFYLQDIK